MRRESAPVSKITPEAEALRVPAGERERRLHHELAVRLYEKRLLPLGKARELAGMEKWEFLELLAAEGVVRSYDLEELRRCREIDASGFEAL